jgi:hypothetical protein
VGADLDFRSIRGAEKILEPGEDWRLLGTDDPVVQEATGVELLTGAADLTEVAD